MEHKDVKKLPGKNSMKKAVAAFGLLVSLAASADQFDLQFCPGRSLYEEKEPGRLMQNNAYGPLKEMQSRIECDHENQSYIYVDHLKATFRIVLKEECDKVSASMKDNPTNGFVFSVDTVTRTVIKVKRDANLICDRVGNISLQRTDLEL